MESDGGSAIAATPFERTGYITKPEDPLKEGYSFQGWYKEDALTTPWDFESDTAGETSFSLYAKWEINSYTLTFDTDGGSPVESITQNYDTEIEVPQEPKKDGFVFAGWDTEIPTTMPAKSMTIKALWDEIISVEVPFTTTIKLGGNTAPEKTTLELELVYAKESGDVSQVTWEGLVQVDAAGDYNGVLKLEGPKSQIRAFLAEGAFFRQTQPDAENWNCDTSLWALVLDQSDNVDEKETAVLIYPATCEDVDDGVWFDFDWNGTPADKMRFTNIYTENVHVNEKSEAAENVHVNERSEATKNVVNPAKTGDDTQPVFGYAAMLASAVVMLGICAYRKKKLIL